MKPLLAALVLLCVAGVARAEDYLDSPALFAAAWERLAGALPQDTVALRVEVEPARIGLIALAPEGGAASWQVRRVRLLLAMDRLEGPEVVAPPVPGTSPEAAGFAVSDLAMERLPDAVEAARMRLDPRGEAEVRSVTIARRLEVGAAPGQGALRWVVELEASGQTLRVELGPEGAPLGLGEAATGAEASGEGEDWPDLLLPDGVRLEEVQAGFEALLPPGALVQDIEIDRERITLSVAAPDRPGVIRQLRWERGRFSPALVDLPERLALPEAGRLGPFRLSDLRLAEVPRLVIAARRASGHREVRRLHGRLVPGVRAERPVWIVRLAEEGAPPGAAGEWEVRLAPGGALLGVVEPGR
ncbi:hypothetical protein [Vannielia litorea]|uniref:Uncharacterized protein n=1 Tax=Vannielia litorea TaxID=1217970 RepID=A0A1N6FKL7_9RHOB|nr:hypothetical protein [Vannielia litorea]SIN95808.1 hypothetical protein SAMN05444002_1746 [Vannielia litorea]